MKREKIFQCSYCPQKFGYKHRKESHELVHQGIKPWKCNQCFKAFTVKHNLVTHLKTHDPG